MHAVPTQPRRGKRLRIALATAVAISGLVPLAASAAGPSTSDQSPCSTPEKCYSLTIAAVSGALEPGSLVTYKGVLSNRSAGVNGFTLGASDVTLPSAFRAVEVQPLTAPRTSSTLGNTIRLRNLSMAPGDSVTFLFNAIAKHGGTFVVESDAKQANNHLGVGNDLTQVLPKPSITISETCGGDSDAEQAKCQEVDKLAGAVLYTSQVNGARLKSRLTIPAVPAVLDGKRFFRVSFRTDIATPECPVVVGLPCGGTVWIKTAIPVEYKVAYGWRMLFDGRGIPGNLPVPVFLQLNEKTGMQEPILPETPLGPIPSPLSGSYANYTDNGDGTYTINNITDINDYKVMNIAIPGTGG